MSQSKITNRRPSRFIVFFLPLSAVGAFLFIGYMFWQQQAERVYRLPSQSTVESNGKLNDYDGWELGVSFQYPAEWHSFGVTSLRSDPPFLTNQIAFGTEEINQHYYGDRTYTTPHEPLPQGTKNVWLYSAIPNEEVRPYLEFDNRVLRNPLIDHLLGGVEEDNDVSVMSINGADVLIRHHPTTAHDDGYLAYTRMILMLDGRVVVLTGLADLDDIPDLQQDMQNMIASMQLVDYSEWHQQHLGYDLSVGNPRGWTLHDNGSFTSIENADRSVTLKLRSLESELSNSQLIALHDGEKSIHELSAELYLSEQSDQAESHTLLNQPDALTEWPQITIAEFQPDDSPNSIVLVALIRPFKSSHLFALETEIPTRLVEEIRPVFNLVARSVQPVYFIEVMQRLLPTFVCV